MFEDEDVKQEMVAWLDEIEELRTSLSGSGVAEKVLLGRMLESDPGMRIGSGEIVEVLGS